ncbi:hypothetical protein DSO57_1011508 [Entomophthora muscae]|uniref:Uncharacterized protein n=1 Tax=Entomophthora muscae TaxID=34485 RepID=A0ACC2TTT9_9FUNG|nr:hypothetical protein DSO57_1011508 [Entomophthora muscae]
MLMDFGDTHLPFTQCRHLALGHLQAGLLSKICVEGYHPHDHTPSKEPDLNWHCKGVRIDISFTLETWDQGQDSTPDPGFLQTSSSIDQGTACPRFPEIETPQAEAKNDGLNGKESQTKGINAPNGGLIKAPIGGNKISTIRFMSLNSTLVANQEPSPEEGTGPQPNPMTTTLEQDNQVAI